MTTPRAHHSLSDMAYDVGLTAPEDGTRVFIVTDDVADQKYRRFFVNVHDAEAFARQRVKRTGSAQAIEEYRWNNGGPTFYQPGCSPKVHTRAPARGLHYVQDIALCLKDTLDRIWTQVAAGPGSEALL